MDGMLQKVAAHPVDAATSAVATVYFRIRGIHAHGLVLCVGRMPRLITRGSVQLGSNVRFRSTMLRGEFGAEYGGSIEVGSETAFGSGVSVVAHHKISIGSNSRIGDFAAIFDTSHHPVDSVSPIRSGPVVIGNNVFIGRASMVMPGVTIGDNSVIGAHSVVTSDVPQNTLVAGSVARKIRDLTIEPGWIRPGSPLSDTKHSRLQRILDR